MKIAVHLKRCLPARRAEWDIGALAARARARPTATARNTVWRPGRPVWQQVQRRAVHRIGAGSLGRLCCVVGRRVVGEAVGMRRRRRISPLGPMAGIVGVRRVPVSAGGNQCWRCAGTCRRAFVSWSEELLSECGVAVDHVTLFRWGAQRDHDRDRRSRPIRYGVGDRWVVDEADVKGGQRVANRLRHH